jgi:hypothetical protein
LERNQSKRVLAKSLLGSPRRLTGSDRPYDSSSSWAWQLLGSAPGATQLESVQRGQILLDQRVALLHAGVAAQRIGGRVIRFGQQSSRLLDFETLIRRHVTKLLHRP